MANTKPLQLHIKCVPPEVKKGLREIAQKKGITMCALVKGWIAEMVSAEETLYNLPPITTTV